MRYVKSSPNKNQTFKSFMNILSIDSKLEIIENFEKVFLRMDFKDASYSAYF